MGTTAYSPGLTSGSVKEFLTQWLNIPNGNTGTYFQITDSVAGASDRSIQFTGTWGAGGSVQLEGSNDGVNWFVLHDPFGNSLIFTANGFAAVTELPHNIRPNVTAGDGSTAINAYLFGRGK